MKRLLKSVFVLGMSQVAMTLVSIVRNKLLAVLLGPRGVGLFAQLQNVQNFLATAIPMGMQTGALKYLAKHRTGDRSQVSAFMASASKVFAGVSVLIVAGCLVFIKPLASWALSDLKYWWLLIPPLAGVPLMNQTQLWQAYLSAGLEFKSLSAALVVTSLAGLVFVVPIVIVWRETGAAFHLLIIAVIGYAVARIYCNRSMDAEMRAKMRSARFDWGVLYNLSRFAAANVLVFVLMTGIPFLVRTKIIQDVGLDANGIYQAVWLFYAQLLGMLVTALATYASARVSQLVGDPNGINIEINNTIKVALFTNVPIILALLLLRDAAILTFFTGEFLRAEALFPWAMVAAYLRVLTFIIGTPIIPQERFKARNILAILQAGTFLAVFYVAPPHLRLQAAVWAEAANWIVNFVLTYGYQRWLNGYGFDRDNWRLFITGGIAVCVVGFLPFPNLGFRMVGAAITALWIATALSGRDRAKLFAAIRERLARRAEPPEAHLGGS